MLKLFLILCGLVFISPYAFSQSSFNGNETLYEESYLELQHINDIDFIFRNKHTNDVAFTHSILIKAFLNQNKTKNRLISFGLKSDLFTDREGTMFYENERLIIAEYFTEISSVEFSSVRFLKKKMALQLAGGIGILNKKKPIAGLSLWLQGGNNGRGGIHKILDNLGENRGQENVSRNYMAPFIYFSPGISRYFEVSERRNKQPHTFVSELGLNLCTNLDATWLFWENDLNLHLLQFSLLKRLFSFDFLGKGDFQMHKNGIKLDARFGTEISYGRIAFGYEITKQFGKANINWIDFSDKEDLFRFFIKVKLNYKSYLS